MPSLITGVPTGSELTLAPDDVRARDPSRLSLVHSQMNAGAGRGSHQTTGVVR